MIQFRILSGRVQPPWLTTLYSILTLIIFAVLFWLALPFIIVIIAVLVLAGVIGYWWLRWKLKKVTAAHSSQDAQEDKEYVKFEILDD